MFLITPAALNTFKFWQGGELKHFEVRPIIVFGKQIAGQKYVFKNVSIHSKHISLNQSDLVSDSYCFLNIMLVMAGYAPLSSDNSVHIVAVVSL